MVQIATNGELKLILAAQTHAHTLEEVWMEGYADAQVGNDPEDNPFKSNTTEARFWEEGWHAGFYEEPALFPEYAVEPRVHHEPEMGAVNDQNEPTWKQMLRSTKAWSILAGIAFVSAAVVAVNVMEMAAA